MGGDLRGCADLAEAVGLGAALGALPFASGGDGRKRVVRGWTGRDGTRRRVARPVQAQPACRRVAVRGR